MESTRQGAGPALTGTTAPRVPGETVSGARVAVGLLLVLPAALALLVGYVLPSLTTVRDSFSRVGLPGTPRESVGFDNYSGLGADTVREFGYALSYVGMPLLVVLVVAPLLAFAAHLAGRRARLAVRLALVLPMVCFAPAVMAVTWLIDSGPSDSGTGDSLPLTMLAGVGLSTFGLVCGIAVTAYLAVLRREGPVRTPVLSGLTVAGIAVLATVATALQVLTFPLVMGAGGRDGTGVTPLFEVYSNGFRQFDLGGAAALSTVLGLVVGLLGLAAAAVVIFTGVRVEVDRSVEPTTRPRPWAVAVTGAVLLVVLGVSLSGLWPWLRPLLSSGVPSGPDTGRLLVNTWLPPLISTVVGVGWAALAGFAIGVLRPLGRYSPLLLVPFAPWLFTGVGPLVIANFLDSTEADTVGTFVGLIPPGWLSIPALFAFTVFFRGQAGRWTELTNSRGPAWAVIGTWLPVLPFVGLVGGATWLIRAQDISWTFATAMDPDRWPGPLYAMQAVRLDPDAVQHALPLVAVILFAAALAALQVWYLDRLTIRAGSR